MARVKRGVQAHRRHKKILARAKGYYGARSRVYRVAFQAAFFLWLAWYYISFWDVTNGKRS